MWPERLLQVAQNIRGMVNDSGTAAFYQLAQLCEINARAWGAGARRRRILGSVLALGGVDGR